MDTQCLFNSGGFKILKRQPVFCAVTGSLQCLTLVKVTRIEPSSINSYSFVIIEVASIKNKP